jgi:hypothetical protein
MINPFTIRKYLGTILPAFISCLFMYFGLIKYGYWGGIGLMILGLVISVPISFKFLVTPFSKMLEGKGLLAMDIGSTGIIKFFTVGLEQPYIKGKIGKEKLEDVWDRNAVQQITPPVDLNGKVHYNNGKLILPKELIKGFSEEEYQKAKFAFNTYPVLIYNSQTKSFLTKDFFGDKEKDVYAEHGILYLNQIVRDLTNHTRDFGRYVAEQLKPKENFFQSKLFLFILIAGLILLAALFVPKIIPVITDMFNTGGGVVEKVAGNTGGIVTPR